MAIQVVKTAPTPNKKQLDCINNTEGRYLVLAGPGTGKTFTITKRIEHLIQDKNIDSEKILCLTFTDAACNEMKKRIEDELGVASCNVQIFTYHGFCCNIIEEYCDDFEMPASYKIMTDSVSKALIKDCIDEINPTYFRTEKNDPYFYINKIKSRIADIKQNRLSEEQYRKNLEQNPDWILEEKRLEDKLEQKRQSGNTKTIGDEKDLKNIKRKINQAIELWQFYELYSQKMQEKNYLDFNDMINMVLKKFEKDPSFLNKIANRYEYIFVDEYQDTNKTQNDIVFSLTEALETKNVFVVGDDDQIIYRFQGAKIDTIENFLKHFPDTKIICLTENMRSTQAILDAARAIIKQDPLSLENKNKYIDIDGNPVNKQLLAKNEEITIKDKPVRLYKYADKIQEQTEIVKEIEAIINSDECPRDKKTGEKHYSEIAILTRSNAEAQEYGELLKQRNIPYELKDGKDIFTIPVVNMLYFYIQILINPEMFSFRLFQLLAIPPFNLSPKGYCSLFEQSTKEKIFFDVLRDLAKGDFKEASKINNFLETYDYLKEYSSKESLKNTILEIGYKTGFFDYYLNNEINRTESIAGIKCFIDEAVGCSEIYETDFLLNFYEYLKAIRDDDETLTTEKAPVSLNAVQLCTYHSSKGREFEYVYMPMLETYKWESNTKSIKSEIPLDISEYKSADEIKNEIKPSDLIKLMYVAMTRAKHTLRLSCPENVNGKAKKLTKFILNIPEFLEIKTAEEYNEVSYWEQTINLLIKRPYDYKKDFEALIRTLLGDRSFSPSSINRYLACPRQYLYNDILKFEQKDGNPNFLSYGLAIHKACEKAYGYLRDNKQAPSKEQVIKWFNEDLAKRPMESYQQRMNFIGRGEKALDEYYCQIVNTMPSMLYKQEETLEYVLEDGTKFKGIIDRIDKNPDGTYTIYDYKTGNNKNADIKIGKDHEDYYNQMAWYKYFYEKATGNKVSLTKFIYPEDLSTKNEGIIYTDEEVQEALEKFKNAVKGIKSCNFEPNFSKKDTVCKYCTHTEFCSLNII